MPIYTKDVAIKDGEDNAQGAKADAAASSDTGTFSGISFWKYLHQKLTGFFGGSINNVAITTQAKVLAGGKSVDITVPTASTIGNAQTLLFDSVTGGLKVSQADIQDYFDSITVAGRSRAGQGTVTRPANTTAYTAGDGIGGLFTLNNVNRGTGVSGLQDPGGYIMSIQVKAPRTAIPAGKKVLVHLFVTSKTVTDNAPFTDDTSSFIGAFEVTMNSFPVTDASSVYVYGITNTMAMYRTTSTTFYGVIVAGEAISPTANGGDIVLTIYTDVN